LIYILITQTSNASFDEYARPALALVQEAGMQGVQPHPQKFWFVANPGKIP